MMYCTNCGTSNKSGREYCESCGTRLPLAETVTPEGNSISQVPKQLRARGVGGLLDETIRLFRQNFRTFVGIVAIVEAPLVFLNIVQSIIIMPAVVSAGAVGRTAQPDVGQALAMAVPAFIMMGVSFLILILRVFGSVVIEAALASSIRHLYLGSKVTIGRAFKSVFSSFWRIMGASLLAGIVIILLCITVIGIPFAIFLGIRWSFIIQAIVLEDAELGKSLSRSTSLVRGSWWRVLGIFIIVGIAQYLVAFIPATVIGYFIGYVGTGTLHIPAVILTMFNMVIGSFFDFLSGPLLPTVTTLLYYDLRIRKEGFDLQMLTEQLQANEPVVQTRP